MQDGSWRRDTGLAQWRGRAQPPSAPRPRDDFVERDHLPHRVDDQAGDDGGG